MSYELKYLKYKNKYILLRESIYGYSQNSNLSQDKFEQLNKNMVGNGLTPAQKEAKKLEDEKLADSKKKLKLSKIDKKIQNMIIDKKIDVDKSIELYNIMYINEDLYFDSIIRENLDINLAFQLVNYLNAAFTLQNYKNKYFLSVIMSISILRAKLKFFGKPEQGPSFQKRLDFLMVQQTYVKNESLYFQYSDEKFEIIKKLTEIMKPVEDLDELIKVIYYSDDKIINILNKIDPPFDNKQLLKAAINIINAAEIPQYPNKMTDTLEKLNQIVSNKYAIYLLYTYEASILKLYGKDFTVYLSMIDDTFLLTLPVTISVRSVINNKHQFEKISIKPYQHINGIYKIIKTKGIENYVLEANDDNDIKDFYTLIYQIDIYQDKQHDYHLSNYKTNSRDLSKIYQPLVIKLREVVSKILHKMLICHNITNETYRNEIINKSIKYAENDLDLFYNLSNRLQYFNVIRIGLREFREKEEKKQGKKIEGLVKETDDNRLYATIMK
jgi:hypothetical protein